MDDNEKTVYHCLYNMVLTTDFTELVEMVNGQIHYLGTQRALKKKEVRLDYTLTLFLL